MPEGIRDARLAGRAALFAQPGVAVTATDPDGAMLAELRQHVPATDQQEVYRRILQVLPETVGISADITVHLARRRRDP